MSLQRKLKRKLERKSPEFQYRHCCGLEMDIKIDEGKAYLICPQCGKIKPYEMERC